MSTPRVLDRILASKRDEIARAGRNPPPPSTRATIDVLHALSRPSGAPLRIVAEVKMKSPSAGELSRTLDAPSRAHVYAQGGAAMVSVLCDAPFFGGGWDHLAAARARIDAAGLAVPLLAKEFVLADVQIDLARANGADAVLVIARIVSREDLARLVTRARAAAVEPLVEVVDEAEVEAALSAGARVVGVNARDLDTLTMDTARAARVLAAIPAGTVAVHLSGIKGPDAVREVASSRADAVLVGEALMRLDDPRPLLAAMIEAAQRPVSL